jgi:hypothetical protein
MLREFITSRPESQKLKGNSQTEGPRKYCMETKIYTKNEDHQKW